MTQEPVNAYGYIGGRIIQLDNPGFEPRNNNPEYTRMVLALSSPEVVNFVNYVPLLRKDDDAKD